MSNTAIKIIIFKVNLNLSKKFIIDFKNLVFLYPNKKIELIYDLKRLTIYFVH